MNSTMTIGLLFKVLDQATAPIKRLNEKLGLTGTALDKAAGKSTTLWFAKVAELGEKRKGNKGICRHYNLINQ